MSSSGSISSFSSSASCALQPAPQPTAQPTAQSDVLLEGIENSVGDVVVRVELHLDGSAGCTPSLVPQFLLHNSE